ncbi:MAG: hypothetical protein GNW80_12930 [Asgard group archaeon]|nr:hypothetical protein [Asgard group archaeon]
MSEGHEINRQIAIWREILVKEKNSWVMFEQGTCLILLEPEEDLRAQAIEIMKMWGPVVPGTSEGDFSVDVWEDLPGWVVYYQHPDMANYVSPKEFGEESEDKVWNDMIIGLIGRNKRNEDAQSLKIVHVEDKRTE